MNARSFLAGVAIMGFAAPALGHAFLEHAAPAAGETLATAPRQVALTFTEQLELAFSGVTVADSAGRDVEAGRVVVAGETMSVALKPLAPGTYRVTWHAVSVDTHRTEGAYSFTVKP
jgi:methionine-rich copper-binding protein CopC